jgi:hypothetical protein
MWNFSEALKVYSAVIFVWMKVCTFYDGTNSKSMYFTWLKFCCVQIGRFSIAFQTNCGKSKIKVTLVQALRLCTGHTTHRGSRGIALLFHDHGIRRWWWVIVTPWPLFTRGKDSVPIVQEDRWAPGPIRTGAKNLTFTGIRSPDRAARSQSLYRLLYRAQKLTVDTEWIKMKLCPIVLLVGPLGTPITIKVSCTVRKIFSNIRKIIKTNTELGEF